MDLRTRRECGAGRLDELLLVYDSAQTEGFCMKTHAAIGLPAGKPLEIVPVDLAGPNAGAVRAEEIGPRGCATGQFTRSRADRACSP
jgi:hypothetical protein